MSTERISTAIVTLTTDASGYQKGVQDAEKQTDAFGKSVQGIAKAMAAAFSFADIAAGISDVVDQAGAIADTAAKLGVSAEAVQKLSFAAEQTGASMDTVAGAMAKMSDNIAGGSKGTTAALDAIGLSIDTLKGMSPDQAFTAIADAIQKVPDPMQQTAVAMDLFGKKGVELLPAIKAGMVEIGEQAPRMSDATVKAADDAGDAWDRQQDKMKALKANALTPLLEGFLALPSGVQTAAAGLASFAPSMETVVTAIIGAGGPVKAFEKLKDVGGGIADFFSMSGGLGKAFIWVATFFTTTLPGAIGTVLAFLGPQGIIALAVLALAGIWYFFGDEITAVVSAVYTTVKEWLVDNLSGVWTTVSDAVSGVAQSFVDVWLGPTGIITTAQNVYEGVKAWLVDSLAGVWSAVKDAALALVTFYVDVWLGSNGIIATAQKVYEGVKLWLLDKFTPVIDLVKGALAVLGTVWTAAKDTIISIATALYTGVKSWLIDKFQAIVDGVKAKIDAVTGFFGDMYDKVVGHSFVPDMVTRIGKEFGSLDGKMTKPAKAATDAVTGLFGDMAARIDGMVGGMLKGVEGRFGSFLSSALPSFGSLLTGGISSLVNMGLGLAMEGIKKIGSAIVGAFQSEETKHVNKPRDSFFNQYGGYEGLASKISDASDGNVANNMITALYASDTASEFNAAQQAIIDLIGGRRFAAGGLVMGPTMGLVGEAGPEVIYPLDRFERMLNNGGRNIEVHVHTDTDWLRVTDQVVRNMPRSLSYAGVG